MRKIDGEAGVEKGLTDGEEHSTAGRDAGQQRRSSDWDEVLRKGRLHTEMSLYVNLELDGVRAKSLGEAYQV